MMDEFELVSELVSRTGASYESARDAYHACRGDMLAAAVMLEQQGYKRRNHRRRRAENVLRRTIQNIFRSQLTLAGEKEWFSLPVPAVIVIAAVMWNILLPAVIIALVLGVQFIFTGSDGKRKAVFGFGRTGRTDGADTSAGTGHTPSAGKKLSLPGTADTGSSTFFRDDRWYDTEEQDNGFFNK